MVTNIEPVQKHDSVHTVEDALTRVSHLQPVQFGSPGFSEASQRVFIEALPPVLVLHLKRFLYGIVKISKPIQFAPVLRIPHGTIFTFISLSQPRLRIPRGLACPEIMAPPIAGKTAEPVHYKLYGVLYHHGESAGSGYYTVDVLHRNEDSGSGEGWLHIDDEVVSTVRHEEVFGSDDDEHVDNRCAYMLFYGRTAPAWT